MELPTTLLQGLEWLSPSVGLVALALLWTALRRRTHVLRWGGWASGLALLGVGVLTQWVSAHVLRWPDGSMAGYVLLLLVLATAYTVCVKKTSFSPH